MLARTRMIGFALIAFGSMVHADVPTSEVLVRQHLDYDADTIKSIFELQPFRAQTRVELRRGDAVEGVGQLINLNPEVSSWYVLSFWWAGALDSSSYHLETAGRAVRLSVVAREHGGATLAGDGIVCDVGVGEKGGVLDTAGRSGLPYAPLCGGALYLRNPVAGHRTSLERVTDFLRDNVWGGDKLIGFVKKELYRDAFLEQGRAGSASGSGSAPSGIRGPAPAALSPEAAELRVVPEHLALDVDTSASELAPGRWYPLRDLRDVSVSTIAPEHIERRLRLGHEASVNALDAVESRALVYLVAFDLAALDLHFVLGTDHPRLDWSDRPPAGSQDARLPGPDGIGSPAPLVMNGMVEPADIDRTVATFAGGFKRSHGAFRHGVLAERNHGSHYGFIQEGVILSKLQPGLATALVMEDGTVDVRTWQNEDNPHLDQVRYARQNGVPLIEYDARRKEGVPGDLVNLWGPGNWSGSANEDLRTLRAGLCLQESPQGRFLIYAYFSAATPSAMARVFQAYHCRYAMHLDMNALEHTYLAAYLHRGEARVVEHLVSGMEEVDRVVGRELAPRFLSFPDDRDFFYLTRKKSR